jgi:AraC-like DNA-binding protein
VGTGPASTYRELAPPPALVPYVACLWVQQIAHGDAVFEQPVLPDGCIDVVAVGDEVTLAGPATRSHTLQLAPGTLTVGVRFRTGTAPSLLGASAAEFRDHDLALDDVWGGAGAALAARVAEPAGWRARLEVLVDGLIDRVGAARAIDPVGPGMAALLAAEPRRPLPQLAEAVGLSERQLRRRVEEAVGYPPRTLARVLRFQRFLRAARASADRSLARLAIEAGYADQAHLTRESRDLAGLPPAALLDWEAARLAL